MFPKDVALSENARTRSSRTTPAASLWKKTIMYARTMTPQTIHRYRNAPLREERPSDSSLMNPRPSGKFVRAIIPFEEWMPERITGYHKKVI